MNGNERSIEGVMVARIDTLLEFKEDGLFIIAVAERYRREIEEILYRQEMKHVYYVDYKWLELIGA